MKKEEAIRFYGTQAKLAEVLDISRQAVSRWGELVPRGKAYELQLLTGGKLRAGNRPKKVRIPWKFKEKGPNPG